MDNRFAQRAPFHLKCSRMAVATVAQASSLYLLVLDNKPEMRLWYELLREDWVGRGRLSRISPTNDSLRNPAPFSQR